MLAWLIGAGAVVALLLLTVLLLAYGDARWSALGLALAAGLAGAIALLAIRSAQARASEQEEAPPPRAPEETGTGLPVHPATGLYRSWIFRQRLTEEVARARRYQRAFTVVLLEPADLLTEPTPEAYARGARALRQALRACDFAAQYDEKRFAVLLPETEEMGAKIAGRRLLATLRSASEPPLPWRGAIISYPEDGADPDLLLRQALVALRQSRLEGAVRSESSAES